MSRERPKHEQAYLRRAPLYYSVFVLAYLPRVGPDEDHAPRRAAPHRTAPQIAAFSSSFASFRSWGRADLPEAFDARVNVCRHRRHRRHHHRHTVRKCEQMTRVPWVLGLLWCHFRGQTRRGPAGNTRNH